ncbi:hypothetical protein A3D66_01500 [Candidatus Kaiserbacteria bacterium RIFCSPHIGHO2_02_FULL_50_9]|uniref:Guanylate kinase n=1 Tax=Candidatus Kaiserbacteria bacterium RIFCSPLOWO2_01_FULL_51_21 TaxID=1798508 RepID=A0A1F6ECZ6_9BACT|nr:MAG: hypothetical protein A2761_02055 [Candidatus Kaiserbacteria bacterium RIFCSPHIGHO2_01_FULL_51_33]OGG63720.1 MAG: hypothetical protein A3D66_01500 [Candidatus Kaiserbacteria bacterium RIFCSPHIGHO2_02_FULL_50_9]OGG71506.1 MAG: hypothetical protein A3A35_02110 [Candidatus Kaiserbacteria bacterium RIFCSPLOWO2_01_FULL_51_21]
MQGRFIVVTGPSAAGKSALVAELLRRIPHSARLVTLTTRLPRPGEKDGFDYYFVSRAQFEERLRQNELFEQAEVYGNLYGSSKRVLVDFLKRYPFVFAVIDVKGARILKEKLPESTVIFLRPGSLQDIERRLKEERMGVPEEEMARRLQTAAGEMALAETFDIVVENVDGRFDETVSGVLKLLGL